MSENIKGLNRSHYCGEVTEDLINETVTIMGWVNKKRNPKSLVFVIVRDRTGIVQVVLAEDSVSQELFEKASSVKSESVVAVKGIVKLRTEQNINPEMKTGKIEIEATEFRILSEAETPPFTPADTGVKEDLRLKYRYIDLRRPELQKNFFVRHKLSQLTREFLSNDGFIEIETPNLIKSTPEGARDYLVPSRIYPGNFYALPQSPQIFKQLLMISGFDKYFQIVKCFRDEDLRADRQPEFTQIDLELSFVNEENIMETIERLVKKIFSGILSIDLTSPFQIMKYKEAMERFGSDKPDLRFGMELVNITSIVDNSEFAVFQGAIDGGGVVKGINATGCGTIPRKQIDLLINFVKDYGAKGLAYIIIQEDGSFKTSLSKFFDDNKLQEIISAFNGKAGDLILICADKNEVVYDSLGALRCEVAKKYDMIKENDFKILWITEFPLLEWSEEEKRLHAVHHPFTAPMDEDIDKMDTDPTSVRARAYDLVINGYEVGGGSIRIYQKEVQEKMFSCLGFSKEDVETKFGYLVTAFKYGAPPHGGFAFGLDRLVMILANVDNIRDVIAFPKVKDASCPLSDAPNVVEESQLEELGLIIRKNIDVIKD